MAKLSFLRGAVTGKLGEFVGSKWKGINYLRLYAKPSNPQTAGQMSIRKVFKALSLFATALFSKGLLALVPPAPKMTERNSVFKANKSMLTNKLFVPASLIVAKSNMEVTVRDISCKFSTANKDITVKAKIALPADVLPSGQVAHFFIYDSNKGFITNYFHKTVVYPPNVDQMSVDEMFDSPLQFNTPEGSLIANCRLFVFISGLDENDKKLISATLSVPVTI
jgi:hypothetical protein